MTEFTEAVAHYFIPRYSNNHRAKLVHPSTLLLISFFLVVYQFILQMLPSFGLRILGYASNIAPEEVIRLTNVKRKEAGVGELSYNSVLAQAALAKGNDMLAKGYWAHVAPDGTQPWKFFMDAGYKYKYAGENLARDFSNPSSAVDAWMASPSHKENLISPKYTDIGIAVVEGNLNGVDTTIIVQLFGTRSGDTQAQIPVAEAKTEPGVTVYPTEGAATVTPTLAVIAQTSPMPTSLPPGSETASGTAVAATSKFSFINSPMNVTKAVSVLTIIVIATGFIVDSIVVYKKKIPRMGGRTLAHLAFFGMILSIIIIAKAGQIL